MALLNDAELERTDVVANSAMNRQRGLAGVNSYARELGLDPLAVVLARLDEAGPSAAAAWLDVCCGTGRALHQAAGELRARGRHQRVRIVGVDLVDQFETVPPTASSVELVATAVGDWEPDTSFDLITCVHGLHYVGDKLGVLGRLARWLAPTGVFVANFDAAAIRFADGRPAGRPVSASLRGQGFEVDTRRHRISLSGGRPVHLPYGYLGADAAAGPNYTGQPAVDSYYAPSGG